MACAHNILSSLVVRLLVLLTIKGCTIIQVNSMNFSYPLFNKVNEHDFIFSENLKIFLEALQVTPDTINGIVSNMSSRILYNQPFKLWKNTRGTKASFISSFVFNIEPLTSPTGDGLAFILTEQIPNSGGQWLGIIHSSTTGLSNIVGVEFDTRKSNMEDIDDNHIGIDVRSAVSMKSQSLSGHGLNLSSDIDIMATVQYDSQSTTMSIFVSSVNAGGVMIEKPIISQHLDLSDYLPEYHKRELVVDDDPEIELKIQSSSTAPQKFHLKELKFATQNFSLMNKLGKGGFGTVYKGTLGNMAVAVKRISKNSRHGKQDFIAEVNSIGNIHHKNLVKLIGWCYESSELLLVYEFMPNGSLNKLIFWNETTAFTGRTLTWERRLNIICGVAQALDYLHNGCEKRVLHRDIKASNIMLDLDFNARLGDFGLARVIQLN
ncbi:hypothetical protein CRYUN_Cryun22dG0036200 [Craigia yunnanensis]